MRIGIISDIHSNIVALKASVTYLVQQNCDEYFFLGDFVSDTPYTRETMDFLYEFFRTHSCKCLRGNREDYMLAQRKAISEQDNENIWLWNSASGNLKFTYEQLTEDDLDYFAGLPICFTYEKEGYPSITCCHGSPENSRELMETYGENTREWLDRISTDYMVCAHTHFPGDLDYHGKHCFNPGCVGIAINDFGTAQCMILDSEEKDGRMSWVPTFYKVPYDHKKVVRDMIEGGLLSKAPWFINSNIQILLTGVDHAAHMVKRAEEHAKAENEKAKWPHIEERFFAEAAAYFGIEDFRDPEVAAEWILV